MVIKHECEVRCNKMAEALIQGKPKCFWSEVKKCRPRRSVVPNTVDGVQGENAIADVFARKFENLYNSVPYDCDEMNVLLRDINESMSTRCECNHCVHGNHCINVNDVLSAVKKLQGSKSDGSTEVMSDHIINAGKKLSVYLSLLFTSMLHHGMSPQGMLNGTMVPIPKGRWANLTTSDNFRAITLSSIFSKIIDVIVMSKECDNLITSGLQFSFKPGASTSVCTAMVQETVSYFVHGGSNVYGLLLDASKAFDRVNYCKLFRVLLDRGICPMYCRLLLNMYLQQKLRIRWNTTYSDYFNIRNGVKQGGVISPVLFCVYIDGLLVELEKCGVGCYMGSVFAGAFGYADDLKLLTPTIKSLCTMVTICERYAKKYDVMFNAKKSQLIVYSCSAKQMVDPIILVNGKKVDVCHNVVHLGHLMSNNIYKFNVSKCIGDFNRQCNMFLADFKNANSYIRNVLFQKYCTSFYGTQLLPLFDNSILDLYKAWRIAMRRVWRLPWQTHCNMLPLIAGVMDPELWFAKRAINFLNMAVKSSSQNVNFISNMARFGTYSIMGGNIRLLNEKYSMDVKNVIDCWERRVSGDEELVRVCEQVKEVVEMRDMCVGRVLDRSECDEILLYLCTG